MRKSRLGLIKVKAEEPKKIVPKKKEGKKETKEKITYTDLIKPKELEIADGVKLVFSVSKADDGNPHVDIRTHITTESYTGMTKKGINFDVESLEEFKNILDEVDSELEKKGI